MARRLICTFPHPTRPIIATKAPCRMTSFRLFSSKGCSAPSSLSFSSPSAALSLPRLTIVVGRTLSLVLLCLALSRRLLPLPQHHFHFLSPLNHHPCHLSFHIFSPRLGFQNLNYLLSLLPQHRKLSPIQSLH